MARSEAASPEEYLAELDDESRALVAALRDTVNDNVPDGYEEQMGFGMITWVVPLAIEPDTYNGQPLQYAALASQKRHVSLYLMGIYADDTVRRRFEESYRATGKRYDVGKSCVRFRSSEDVPFDVIAEAVAAIPVDVFVERARSARR